MPYDVEAIRKRIKENQNGKRADPDEFRPEKANSATEPRVYRFFILPPVELGEMVKGGPAKKGMDSQFYVTHGNHWVNDKPHPCPRVWDGTECPICSFGFDLLKDEEISKNDEKRRATVKMWMPNQQYMMNIFFPETKQNPEDLHNRVMFYNAPKTVLDICVSTLMRTDAGDPENPEAFGVFFDENNANLFELQILKQGKQNSYKTSKHLATPRAMIRNSDGSPNDKAIAKMLTQRHDLFSKIESPNMEKITRVFQGMVNGDDSGDDNKKPGGFDEDETKKTSAPAGKKDTGTVQTSTKVTTTRKAAVVDDDDDVGTVQAKAKVKPPVDDDDAPPAKKVTKPVADDLDNEAPLPKDKPKEVVKEDKNPELDSLLSQLDDGD